MEIIPELMCEDVNRSIDFYREALGFKIEFKTPETGKAVFVLMKNGEAALMLYERPSFENEIEKFAGEKIGGTFCLYIKIPNIEEVKSQIGNKAKVIADIHETDYGQTEMVIEDPNGYVLILAQN